MNDYLPSRITRALPRRVRSSLGFIFQDMPILLDGLIRDDEIYLNGNNYCVLDDKGRLISPHNSWKIPENYILIEDFLYGNSGIFPIKGEIKRDRRAYP